MNRTHLYAGALLAAVAAAAVIFVVSHVDTAEHSAYEAKLREIVALDRKINIDVLEARFGLIHSYDGIVKNEASLEAAAHKLATPRYLDDDQRADVDAAADVLKNAIEKKRNRVEHFKALNSVLQNSLRYVPTVARADNDASVRREVADVLEWDVSSDEADGARLLNDLVADELDGGEEHALTAHLQSIVSSKPRVDALVRKIVDAEVTRAADRVESAYARGFAAVELRGRQGRIGLYILSTLLLALVAATMVRLRQSSRALARANAQLEDRVSTRTAELAARTSRLEAVLANIRQGIAVADDKGVLDRERSAAFDRMSPASETRTIGDWLSALDDNAARWVDLAWRDLFAGDLPFEVVAAQLPSRVTSGDRVLELAVLPFGDDAERALIVVTDATDAVERERAEAEGKDLLALLDLLARDRASFLDFVDEIDDRLSALAGATSRDRRAAMREAHTLKGSCALIGLNQFAARCHALEDVLGVGDDREVVALDDVMRSWVRLREKMAAVIDAERTALADLAEVAAADKLEALAGRTRSLAERLGKDVDVVVEADGILLDRDRFRSVWPCLVHLTRNAADHGVETAEERNSRGKSKRGKIGLGAARADDGSTVLWVDDDGAGVNWAAVKSRAIELGLPASTDDDLRAALFADALSTKPDVTDVSGRGVGLAAVLRELERLDGSISVHSVAGKGTRFEVRIPT